MRTCRRSRSSARRCCRRAPSGCSAARSSAVARRFRGAVRVECDVRAAHVRDQGRAPSMLPSSAVSDTFARARSGYPRRSGRPRSARSRCPRVPDVALAERLADLHAERARGGPRFICEAAGVIRQHQAFSTAPRGVLLHAVVDDGAGSATAPFPMAAAGSPAPAGRRRARSPAARPGRRRGAENRLEHGGQHVVLLVAVCRVEVLWEGRGHEQRLQRALRDRAARIMSRAPAP